MQLVLTARICSFLLAVSAVPASAADIVLRFGSVNTEGTAPYDQALVPIVRAIEQESGGRIEVALKSIGGYASRLISSTWLNGATSKWRRRCRATIPAAFRNPR